MKEITLDVIMESLRSDGIDAKVYGPQHSAAKLCSLYNVETRGLYYVKKEVKLDSVPFRESIIITDVLRPEIRADNTQIVVNTDPQRAFYKLSRRLHPVAASTGIHPTAIVSKDAIIHDDVEIGPYSVIGAAEIHQGARIDAHVVIYDKTTIGERTLIESNTSIGATGMAWIWDEDGSRIVQPQTGGVIIEEDCLIGTNITIVRGSVNENTVIGGGTTMAHGTLIGHGAHIGKLNHFANNISIAGNVRSGAKCFFGSGCVVRPQVSLAEDVIVGAGAVVTKDFSDSGIVLTGVPARILKRKGESGLSGVPNSR